MPADCMSAYIVVGPDEPEAPLEECLRRRDRLRGLRRDLVEALGTRPLRGGANDHSRASSAPSSSSATSRALEIVAPILARLRTMPASSSVVRHRLVECCDRLGSNPANASRNRRALAQDRDPGQAAWNPSRLSFSKRARSPWRGTPHSSSWYRRYSSSSPDPCASREAVGTHAQRDVHRPRIGPSRDIDPAPRTRGSTGGSARRRELGRRPIRPSSGTCSGSSPTPARHRMPSARRSARAASAWRCSSAPEAIGARTCSGAKPKASTRSCACGAAGSRAGRCSGQRMPRGAWRAAHG